MASESTLTLSLQCMSKKIERVWAISRAQCGLRTRQSMSHWSWTVVSYSRLEEWSSFQTHHTPHSPLYLAMVAMVSTRFTLSLVSTIHAVSLCRR